MLPQILWPIYVFSKEKLHMCSKEEARYSDVGVILAYRVGQTLNDNIDQQQECKQTICWPLHLYIQ